MGKSSQLPILNPAPTHTWSLSALCLCFLIRDELIGFTCLYTGCNSKLCSELELNQPIKICLRFLTNIFPESFMIQRQDLNPKDRLARNEPAYTDRCAGRTHPVLFGLAGWLWQTKHVCGQRLRDGVQPAFLSTSEALCSVGPFRASHNYRTQI